MITPYHTQRIALLPPTVIGLVSVAYLIRAYGFGAASGAMPIMIGWAMIVLTALDLLTRLRRPMGSVLARALPPPPLHSPPASVPPFQLLRQLVAVLAVLVFVVAIIFVGILPTVPIFTFVALRLGARRGWLFSLIGSIGMVVPVWAVFVQLLGLTSYPGLLFGGEW